MSGGQVVLIPLPDAEEASQLVGPYPWTVLLHLARRVDPTAHDAAVETSVREIANRQTRQLLER